MVVKAGGREGVAGGPMVRGVQIRFAMAMGEESEELLMARLTRSVCRPHR